MAGERSQEPAGTGRRILHCDMDCFYAAVHIRDDPSLAGRPVIVAWDPKDRGVVVAASYEARRYGVHSALPSVLAHRLCPQGVYLKPDFARYRRESRAIFEIFRGFSPLIETLSLDEAYLDVSDRVTEWGSATRIARAVRARVREERRLAVSVGVAPNKLVAKIASDFHKPDGLTVVPPRRVQEFLDPLPVRSIPGVGPATEKVLLEMGLTTIAELRRSNPGALLERFGANGERLILYAHGRDERPVETSRERKSLSSERSFAPDLADPKAIRERLRGLAREVAQGLATRNLSACTVTIKVRYPDFTTVTRSLTSASPVVSAAAIGELAERLLDRTEGEKLGVRLLGVGTANFIHQRIDQLDLF